MNRYDLVGIISATLGAIAFIPYVIALFRKENPINPSKPSWVIWAIMGLAIYLGSKSTGATATLALTAVYAALPVIFLILLIIKNRRWEQWTRLDFIQLSIGLALLLPWVIFKMMERFEAQVSWKEWLPVITLCGSIIVDGYAAWFTVSKSWKNPEGEDTLAWGIMCVGNTLYLWAVDDWSWSNWIKWVYPVYVTLPSGFILPPLLWHSYKKWRIKHAAAAGP